MKAVKLHYSKELVAKVVGTFCRRVINWRFFAAMLALALLFTYSVATGDRSWFMGMVATGLILGVIFPAAVYLSHYRQSMRKLVEMKTPEALLELDDETFRITSGAGRIELNWNVVKQLWCYRDFWVLVYSPSQFSTLPAADLDDEARQLLRDRIVSHGGKVDLIER